MTTVRRPKWHAQPPPTPRILHLPRRNSRRNIPVKNAVTKPISDANSFLRQPEKGKLESLFDQERAFSYSIPPVVLLNSGERGKNENSRESEEEESGFQAEMLRAECNFLRMEREIAVKKLEKERVVLEKSLKSAVLTLLSGKKKIREGENTNALLEEEIEELAKKLVELQKSSKIKSPELDTCSSNFDKQASLLQKHLEKYSDIQDECFVKEISEVSSVRLPLSLIRDGKIKGHGSSRRRSTRFTDVETLRRKMEGLSKGKLLKRMEEEYGFMLSATATSSVPSSASTSGRYDLADSSSLSFQNFSEEAKLGELKTCTGHCKAIVRRIMEQVKDETEQWSQMQEMLGKVREEMEEVQASRHFWEEQALESEHKIKKMDSDVEEWKQKALSLEMKENQLQNQVQELQQELEKLKVEKKCENDVKVSKGSALISLGAQLAREKRMLMCRVKGNQTSETADKIEVDYNDAKKTLQKIGNKLASVNRHPFKEISNLSPLVRQNSRRYVYPLHSPHS